MHAMVLDQCAPIETHPLQYRELPEPVPGRGEVKVRVRCCAVCRTDLHVIEGDLPTSTLPIIPGHQVVGVVEALGPGCTERRIGERVGIAWLHRTCGGCHFCRGGKENLCEQAVFTGYHVHGGYAEKIVAPEAFVYPLSPAVSDIEAAPLLCAGIIGYRAFKRCAPPVGGSLALVGFGSSAHLLIQLARYRGYRVFVVSHKMHHQDLARRLGAVWAGSRAEDMPEEVDAAIIFAPVGALVPPILARLRRGGTLALAGIHMSDIPSLRYAEHLYGERDIHPVTANTREDGREWLAAAAEAGVRAATTQYPLADANEALCDLKEGRFAGTAVLMVEEGEAA